MKSPVTSTLLILGLLLAPAISLAYSSGPPNGRTNAPGETNCTACHNTFPLNSGTGTLTVSDLGAWVPGQTYDLTVDLADPDAVRWGFEFTILDQDGLSVGTLASLDSHTQISAGATRDYAKQTTAGTQTGTPDQAAWTVRWTAPAEGAGDLTLYMAGNAANGNSASSNDRIYAISSTWTESSASPAPLPALAGADLLPNYPNPFNPRTTLAFELARDGLVELAVYSLDGRLVRNLLSGNRSAGRHDLVWDGLDRRGQAAPSGTYLYRLKAGGQLQTRTMTLVR